MKKESTKKDEIDQLVAQLEKNRRSLTEKDITMTELEFKAAEEIEEMKNTIVELQTEKKEKDSFIRKLQKQIKDFEDEVFEEEKKFEARQLEQKRLVEKLIKEMNEIKQQNRTLLEQIMQNKEEQKELANKLRILQKISDEKAVSIETLEVETEMYRNELSDLHKKLKTKNKELENIIPNSQPLLTKRMHQKQRKGLPKNNKIINDRPMTNNRRKVKFVTNSQGKHMGTQLFRLLGDTFSVESIVKTNADENELLKSAISNAETLTENDILVVWPNKCSKQLIQRLLIPLKHIQTIIITQPYHKYNYKNVNDVIYYSNLELKREAIRASLGHTILECNGILRRNNYTRNSITINEIGKYYLGISIRNWIYNRNVLINKCKSSEERISANRSIQEVENNIKEIGSLNGSELDPTPSLAEEMTEAQNEDQILDKSIVNIINNTASNNINFQSITPLKTHR